MRWGARGTAELPECAPGRKAEEELPIVDGERWPAFSPARTCAACERSRGAMTDAERGADADTLAGP